MGVDVREMGERHGARLGLSLRRAALLAVFALSGAVAAIAAIVPSSDA